MKNVIDACKINNTRLVFFDNIYMYDGSKLDPITEDLPINPPSKKGKVRAEIANMLHHEIKEGHIAALIARSADFYGPEIKETSLLKELAINPLLSGKAAKWFSSLKYKHSFTYTPDAAKATAILGNTPDAYGQVWHLPTAGNPPTGKEWIEKIAAEIEVKPKVQVVPKWLASMMGLFIPVMGELAEMMYQYDKDYVFDSSKFEKRFDFVPTSYDVGIKKVILRP
jgi:nucleoside-diphosphate-sugar epimerase